MMGAHHAVCGAAAWVALTSSVEVPLTFITEKMGWADTAAHLGFGLLEVGPIGIVTGALVCAGAALVPDADHHNATIAHSLPPLSNVMCGSIGKLSGGHRHGTHSIVGITVFTVIAYIAGLLTFDLEGHGPVYAGAGIMTVLLAAFAAKALKIIPDRMRKSPWAVGLAAGALVAFFPPEHQHWFPIAMGLGVVVHILGDMMTTGGCNLAWPMTLRPPKFIQKMPVINRCWMKNGYLAFPVLGNAGSIREWLLLVPLSLYVLAGVAAATVATGRAGIEALMASL